MADTNFEEDGGFLARIKESPRTVSALIIILIVAAAIYAFSGDTINQPAAQERVGEDVAATQEGETAADEEAERSAPPAGGVAGEADEGAAMTSAETKEMPQPRRTDEGYVEVAQAGEGYTHLARRAATQWLSENQASYAVTDEHRIYIEDYIQNRMGTEGLELGDSHTITFDMIREAVDAASSLNESQLQNLSHYTSALQT